jgi:hypothetical protein
MGFLEPSPPPFDLEEWKAKPHLTRLKPLVQDWGGERIRLAVDVVSGLTLRHELFPRMVDRRRLIPSGEFVPAAEQFGSIREIDRWVVGRAIEIAARGRPST